MAESDNKPRESAAEAITIQRAAAAQQRAVLALLLTGRTRGQAAAVDQFLTFAAGQSMPLDELWAAWRGGEPVAAAMFMPAAGRSAMIFLSPSTQPGWAELGMLVQTAAGAQDRRKLRLVQAILDPWQERERRALESAGLRCLANLVYMQRAVTPPAPESHVLSLGEGFEVVHWSENHRPLFAEAILASYQQTLDCPALVGLRSIEEIIDGHMAAGQFSPELWWAVRHGDEPVGVMLLSPLPQRSAMELVYLGLAPAWRGKGLGSRLLKHGLAQTHQRRLTSMLLAVDDLNKPAMGLYQSLGFEVHARKLAMIMALS